MWYDFQYDNFKTISMEYDLSNIKQVYNHQQ